MEIEYLLYIYNIIRSFRYIIMAASTVILAVALVTFTLALSGSEHGNCTYVEVLFGIHELLMQTNM